MALRGVMLTDEHDSPLWARLTLIELSSHPALALLGIVLTSQMQWIKCLSFSSLEDEQIFQLFHPLQYPFPSRWRQETIRLLSLPYGESIGYVEHRNKLSDLLGFTAMFASLATACPLGLSNLSHHLIIPPILQAMSPMLFQQSVAKINMTT